MYLVKDDTTGPVKLPQPNYTRERNNHDQKLELSLSDDTQTASIRSEWTTPSLRTPICFSLAFNNVGARCNPARRGCGIGSRHMGRRAKWALGIARRCFLVGLRHGWLVWSTIRLLELLLVHIVCTIVELPAVVLRVVHCGRARHASVARSGTRQRGHAVRWRSRGGALA